MVEVPNYFTEQPEEINLPPEPTDIPQVFTEQPEQPKPLKPNYIPQFFAEEPENPKEEKLTEIPEVFTPQPESSIASYNFADVADGTGYVNFYPCALLLSGSTTYGMVNTTAIPSGEVTNRLSGAAPTPTTIDYDIVFNVPKRIKGNVYLSFSVGDNGNDVGDQNMAIAKLYKYDGSTTTQLGSTLTTPNESGGGGTHSSPMLLKFDLSGQVYSFKKSETLRLEIYFAHVGSAGSIGGYGHDPTGTADTTILESTNSSRMTLSVPFIIDV